MRVLILGQVEAVTPDAEPVPIVGPNQRRMLAALALRRNNAVSVARLVDAVWPDGEPPDRAEHSLRTYVHRLRTSLDGDGVRVETVSGGYRLRLAADELDAAEFERLVALANRYAEVGDSAAALDAIGSALALWRGDPFGEFEHERWAAPTASRLRDQWNELRATRAEMLMESGRPREAVGLLEELVCEEPLHERPRGLLMRALYEAGRQAEALRAFQDFRRRASEEVGIEPSSELVELDRAIACASVPPAERATHTVRGYELHERIGVGAFAVVHRATQSALGRQVAVKVIRAELANQAEFIRRFEAEARMVAAIENPNVVPLYDFWREPDRAFLVMRWMTAGSLESRLDKGPVEPADALVVVEQVAAALEAAHRIGVVHRDVKPANVLFDDDGRAHLADFGIALAADDWGRPEAALSEGSPVYASPEQLRREPAGPEADVFALATVAYTMLAGRSPFADAPDQATQLRRQLNDPIPALSDIVPGLPAAVDEVLAMATAKAPADRYPTAADFAFALRAAFVAPGDADRSVLLRPRQNPYKGLAAFEEADAGDFYGRERLVDELVDHLARPDARMLAVVGPSGSGKSSVVRAGLVPALRRGRLHGSSDWFVTTMTPGARPYEALETALLRVAVNPPAALLDQLRDGDRGILRAVRRIAADDDGVVLIVIDQFEELFAPHGVATDERNRFLRALSVAVTEPGSPVRVVLTLRADFYDRPLLHPTFAPVLKAHTVVVTPLAADELEHAIATPAATVGVELEPGLVVAIVADVTNQPGGLPLLQYALTCAFEATDGDVVTTDTYRVIGGITGALADRAEELFAAADTAEQIAMRRAFGRLVTVEDGSDDTRRRARLREFGDDAPTRAVIDRLGRARLLTFNRDPATREPTVEVAHEALIREWPRLLQWLDEDRDMLRVHRHLSATAASWADRGGDADELYSGSRLEAAEPLLHDDTVALTGTETAFLHVSREAADARRLAEQRRTKRFRRLAIGLAVALIAVAVAGVTASLQRLSAQRNADQAERVSIEATSRRLAVEAVDALDVDPDLAIQLALESFRRTATAGVEPVEGSIEAIHTVTQASRLLARFAATGAAAINPAGDVAALARDDAVVTVDAATGNELAVTSLGAPVLRLVYHPSGDRLVAVTKDSIVVLDGARLDVVAERTLEHSDYAHAVFHPSGDRLAFDHAQVLRVVDAIDLSTVQEMSGVGFVGWTADDLVIIDEDGIARVGADGVERRVDLPLDGIGWADSDPDGDRLVVLSDEGGHVVSLDDPDADPILIDAQFGVAFQGAELSPDGEAVYAFGPSDEVRVIPLGAGATYALRGNEGVRWVEADADARRLLVVGSEESLLWDLTTEGPAALGAVTGSGAMEFSRDGNVMYVADEMRHILAVDFATGRTITTGRTIATSDEFGTIWALAPGGLVAGTMVDETAVRIEDLSTGSTRLPPPCTFPVAIDADARWIISGQTDDAGCDGVVDLRSGEMIVQEPGGIGLAAIGPPGTISDGVAAYQSNMRERQPTPTLIIRDLSTGREIAHTDMDMWKPFFSNDGRFITFGSSENGGVVIDVEQVLDGTPIEDAIVLNPRLTGATSFPRVVGDDFVTGHAGEFLRFWRLDDGKLRLTLPVESGDTTYIAPTPDDRYLYYETEGNLFRRFPMEIDDLIALAEQRAQRDFTVDECDRYALSDTCEAWVSARAE